VNNGEVYDFTYADLVQNGDIVDYGTVRETPTIARLSVRLTEAIPVPLLLGSALRH